MKLIRESVEAVNYLSESNENGKKSLFIEGRFLVAEEPNKNRRMYKINILENEAFDLEDMIDDFITFFIAGLNPKIMY